MRQLCWKCRQTNLPLERIAIDDKKRKWAIKQCPRERCSANWDIAKLNIKLWNGGCFFDETESIENK
jgi:hypothetical protein